MNPILRWVLPLYYYASLHPNHSTSVISQFQTVNSKLPKVLNEFVTLPENGFTEADYNDPRISNTLPPTAALPGRRLVCLPRIIRTFRPPRIVNATPRLSQPFGNGVGSFRGGYADARLNYRNGTASVYGVPPGGCSARGRPRQSTSQLSVANVCESLLILASNNLAKGDMPPGGRPPQVIPCNILQVDGRSESQQIHSSCSLLHNMLRNSQSQHNVIPAGVPRNNPPRSVVSQPNIISNTRPRRRWPPAYILRRNAPSTVDRQNIATPTIISQHNVHPTSVPQCNMPATIVSLRNVPPTSIRQRNAPNNDGVRYVLRANANRHQNIPSLIMPRMSAAAHCGVRQLNASNVRRILTQTLVRPIAISCRISDGPLLAVPIKPVARVMQADHFRARMRAPAVARSISVTDGARSISVTDDARSSNVIDDARSISVTDGARSISVIDGARPIAATVPMPTTSSRVVIDGPIELCIASEPEIFIADHPATLSNFDCYPGQMDLNNSRPAIEVEYVKVTGEQPPLGDVRQLSNAPIDSDNHVLASAQLAKACGPVKKCGPAKKFSPAKKSFILAKKACNLAKKCSPVKKACGIAKKCSLAKKSSNSPFIIGPDGLERLKNAARKIKNIKKKADSSKATEMILPPSKVNIIIFINYVQLILIFTSLNEINKYIIYGKLIKEILIKNYN